MGGTVLKKDIPYLIDLYQQGRLKLDELVTRKYSLDEINEAIEDVKSGKSRRNVIVFD
jgi:Zn-dependent alcohol dehydrogenase